MKIDPNYTFSLPKTDEVLHNVSLKHTLNLCQIYVAFSSFYSTHLVLIKYLNYAILFFTRMITNLKYEWPPGRILSTNDMIIPDVRCQIPEFNFVIMINDYNSLNFPLFFVQLHNLTYYSLCHLNLNSNSLLTRVYLIPKKIKLSTNLTKLTCEMSQKHLFTTNQL